MFRKVNVEGVVFNIAAVMAHHRDDFDRDEDYQQAVELMAETVAPLVGSSFNRQAWIASAMLRSNSERAKAKALARMKKREAEQD